MAHDSKKRQKLRRGGMHAQVTDRKASPQKMGNPMMGKQHKGPQGEMPMMDDPLLSFYMAMMHKR